ncbi:MAG: TIGR03619 family F420-dependent LLM class oxidoreductase [Myxococcota bacterium]|nr:TIGR03619 family F420-dependent LLM class oxidoreductase [Myxococcota bacterium]
MDIGYFGLNQGPFCDPENMAALVKTLEQAGYESVWTGEHVVLMDPHEAPSPVPPETPFLDTIAALSFAAAHSRTLKLGSGIILLPQRNPVVLAKELAGVDVLSGGRLLFGVGAGYVPREFETLGIPYAERGARMTEHIEVIRTLWTEERPTFDGRFTRISGIQSHPHPRQNPHSPIHVGGMSTAAHKRAVAHGNGWYGFFLDPGATEAALKSLEEAAGQVERPAGLGDLEITITPPGPVDADTMKRFEDLGVHRLVLMRSFEDMGPRADAEAKDRVMQFLEDTALELKLA